MKKFLIATLAVFSLYGCAGKDILGHDNSWRPYVGCSEEELYSKWGYGGDSRRYESAYGDTEITWYTQSPFGVMSGCKKWKDPSNFLYHCVGVTLQDGKVVSVSN